VESWSTRFHTRSALRRIQTWRGTSLADLGSEGRPATADAVLALLVGLVAFVVAVTRLPRNRWDTLYAEDGRVFLANAASAPLRHLLEPYGGYLQLVPRIIGAIVASVLPPRLWAYGSNGLTALCTAVVAGAVVFYSAGVVRSKVCRALLGLLTVFLPLFGFQVIDSSANVHSLLLWLGFWVVLWPVTHARGALLAALVILAIALSEPQCVFLIPVAVFQLVTIRGGWSKVPALFLGVGLVAQAVAGVVAGRSMSVPPGQRLSIGRLLKDYLFVTPLPFWDADHAFLVAAIGRLHSFAGVLAVLPVIGCLVLLVGLRCWAQLLVSALALSVSVAATTSSLWINTSVFFDPVYLELDREDPKALTLRYGVAAGLLFGAVLLLTLDALWRRHRRAGVGAAAVLALVVVLPWAGTYSVPSAPLSPSGGNARFPARGWVPRLDAARAECSGRPASSTVAIPITPSNWSIDLTCRQVLS
jgi:hypothetical protein